MVESNFNEVFPPEGIDDMNFGDLIHHLHPLFHQNETTIDPSNQFLAETLLTVWKDIIKEYCYGELYNVGQP
jgi:hypothetical protein